MGQNAKPGMAALSTDYLHKNASISCKNIYMYMYIARHSIQVK
jgi:hypothetical protein